MRRLLVIFRHGPHGLVSAREGLDMVFAAVAYECEVSLLFLDDGVALLKRGQNPVLALQKDYARGFAALLEHRELERVGVERESLMLRGLVPEQLFLRAELLDCSAASRWLGEADAVLTF